MYATIQNPNEIALYQELTIRETLAYFGRLHHMKGDSVKSRTEFLLDFLNLPHDRKLVKNLRLAHGNLNEQWWNEIIIILRFIKTLPLRPLILSFCNIYSNSVYCQIAKNSQAGVNRV
uniref:Uncharacterized protein n=1 Tax=Strigamia maritima TaxID=126957 RepID=T1JJT7_STRMM